MRTILILAFISGILLLSAIILLLISLWKKKSNIMKVAVFALLLSIGTGGYTVYVLANKTYHALQPRTGSDIYTALFGKPASNCVKVLHYQDQVVPKIDYAIWLHFRTCPDEMKRILSKNHYEFEKVSESDTKTNGPSANNNWFKPELMGDSVLTFKFKKDEYGNGQTIYINRDSTEAYCIDVLD
jgi:hypothetical protein